MTSRLPTNRTLVGLVDACAILGTNRAGRSYFLESNFWTVSLHNSPLGKLHFVASYERFATAAHSSSTSPPKTGRPPSEV
jgi:hypothetical protein